jgi:hypothetical protein
LPHPGCPCGEEKKFQRDHGVFSHVSRYGEKDLIKATSCFIKDTTLEETGGTDMENIIEKLHIKPSDLEREIATLRHMEKVRGELTEGKKILRLW